MRESYLVMSLRPEMLVWGMDQNPEVDAQAKYDGDGAALKEDHDDNPLPSREWTIEHVRSILYSEHVFIV
jgi:hypothetical protein